VNCQLYSGWRLGKRKPGSVPNGEGLVETAGESIEVRGVGFCGGVRIGAREGDSARVIDLCDEAFREETVPLGEGGTSYRREGGSYALCKGMEGGARSSSEEMS